MSTTSEEIKEKLFKIVSRLEEAIPEIKKMIEEEGFSHTVADGHRSRREITLSDGVVAEDIELNEGEIRISFFSLPEEN